MFNRFRSIIEKQKSCRENRLPPTGSPHPACDGCWSGAKSFTTLPAPPALTAPSNNSPDQFQTVKLAWTAVNGAISYRVQVSPSSNFTESIFAKDNITTLSWPVTGLDNSNGYFWRAAALGNGGWSDWSQAWSFTVNATRAEAERGIFSSSGVFIQNGTLHYELLAPGRVSVSLITLDGRKVLLFDRFMGAGSQRLPLMRAGVANGSYVVQFRAGAKEKRMLLLAARR